MSYRLRSMLCCACAGLMIPSAGCALVPQSRLAACQSYNCELQRKNQEICAQYENLRLQNQQLANKNLDLEDQMASQEQLIANYQKRISDHQGELDQMLATHGSLLDASRSNPLPRDVRKQLEEFARRHPEFVEVDADAGISKFKSDVLFPSGRAELSPESERVLQEFASIFQNGNGRALKIMVVGHTDRQRIAKPETKALHESNWHLSAHRAIAVEEYLARTGIDPHRMGVVGYGQHQPLDTGNSATALAKNRRVEIYVLAPDAAVVGRTDRAGRY